MRVNADDNDEVADIGDDGKTGEDLLEEFIEKQTRRNLSKV